MKNKNGFTLVELLAVIVILAIIMIIAIPSVLGTMTVAKQKTFIEFMEKAYTTTQKKISEDQMLGKVFTVNTIYVYDVKTDLGLSSTGSYSGVVFYYKYPNGDEDFYVSVFDDEYAMIWNFAWGVPEPDTVKEATGGTYQMISASEFANMYSSFGIDINEKITAKQVCDLNREMNIEGWAGWTGIIYDASGVREDCYS